MGGRTSYFPDFFAVNGSPPSFSPYHIELWKWVWSLQADVRPDPLVAIWPREESDACSTDLFPPAKCLDRSANHPLGMNFLGFHQPMVFIPCKPSPCKPVGRQSGILRVGACFVFG
jgi:hypothetical protein